MNLHRSQWMKNDSSSFDFWIEKTALCVKRDIEAKMKGRRVDSIQCRNKGGR